MCADLRDMKYGKIDYDGIIGPATRSALAQAVAAGRIVEINNLIVDKRIAELNTKGHKKSNSGWFARAESFRIAPAVSPGQPGTPCTVRCRQRAVATPLEPQRRGDRPSAG